MWTLWLLLVACGPSQDTVDSDVSGTETPDDGDTSEDSDTSFDDDSEQDTDGDTDVDTDLDTERAPEPSLREQSRRWRLTFEDDFDGPTTDGDPCYDAVQTAPVCMDRYWSNTDCASELHDQIADLNKCTWALYDIYNWMDWGLAARGEGMTALDPAQVAVVDGELRLSADHAATDGPWDCGVDQEDYFISKNCPIRAGAVHSNPDHASTGFDQAYGRFEVRAIIPNQLGAWPAHWLLPTGGGWPNDGEIDIMEAVAHDPSDVHGSFHGGMDVGDVRVHHSKGHHHDPGEPRFANDWHTYAVEWTPDRLRFYVDDWMTGELLAGTALIGDVIGANDGSLIGSEWPAFPVDIPDDPFYFILNTSVVQTGGWNIDDFEALEHRIDWVRVYEGCPSTDETCSIVGSGSGNISDRFWMSPAKWAASFRVQHSGDFDGDGLDDLLLQTALDQHATYWMPGHAVDGFDHERTVTTVDGMSASRWDAQSHALVVLDVNGDGADDALLVPRGAGSTRAVLGSAAGPSEVVDLTSRADWVGHEPVVGDFNGDTRADVLLLPTGPTGSALRLLGRGDDLETAVDVTNAAGMNATRWTTSRRIPHVADLDGDGDDDVLLQPRTRTSFPIVLLSTPTGFLLYDDWTDEGGINDATWAAADHVLHLVDMDGDGDADVHLQGRGGADQTRYARNDGGQLATAVSWTFRYGLTAADWAENTHAPVWADVNGDAAVDLLLVGRGTADTTWALLADDGELSDAQDWTRRNALGPANWSSRTHEPIAADVDGDGADDVILRGRSANDNTLLLFGGLPAAHPPG